ncbi:hypothetical protein [Amycolatopsis nigrescens]|uniref:hypothetical protein n=1 Tax=Amycolatopsis nigrescens TaxID=381445 RepID=UPI00039AD023|nr:hypothetical protein [Amycolatopsis nigrescens]
MPTRTYLRLPINADEGFPQAFRLAMSGRNYLFRLHANVAEEMLEAAVDGPLELPSAGAFLVLSVEREEPGGLVGLFRRKLVPGVEYLAAELALTFAAMRLDPRNLNGAGSFGSVVRGGVAPR